MVQTLRGQFLGIHPAADGLAVEGVAREGPVLAAQALEVATGDEDGVTLRRSGVQSPGRDQRARHAANAPLAGHAVYTTLVLTQGALFQIIFQVQLSHSYLTAHA